MEIEKIQATVGWALSLRAPKWEQNNGRVAPATKIAALEDYLLESAYCAADLEEALWWLDGRLNDFQRQIDQMTGYEVALPRKTRDRITKDDILHAKRIIDPATFDAGAEAKLLRQTILRQIERLRFEEQWVVSRAYSMISGR